MSVLPGRLGACERAFDVFGTFAASGNAAAAIGGRNRPAGAGEGGAGCESWVSIRG
ncbi:hypothetical protein GCM10027570_26320 [Streptomonospora sediminis]